MKTPGYQAAHDRLIKAFGSASIHLCECGAPATTWAYDHADPDEILEIQTEPFHVWPYSLDPVHYRPLCHSCHYRLDHPLATHCSRGHEYTPENTYARPDGYRECRTCNRERQRRYSERRRWL